MANDYPKEYPISWEQFHRQSRELGLKLKDMGAWKGILAVTRGGLVPAGLVAQEMSVKNIQTISIESYSHQDQSKDQSHPLNH